jgi:hypothetical protein
VDTVIIGVRAVLEKSRTTKDTKFAKGSPFSEMIAEVGGPMDGFAVERRQSLGELGALGGSKTLPPVPQQPPLLPVGSPNARKARWIR